MMLEVEQRPPIGPTLRSKLHLIDLAGSEDNRRTGNQGERLVESGAINSSLFVLGQVVDALNKSAPRIPYRDSKLTRLLQDSLGGKSFALVITNIALTEKWLYETAASLNFASKSRQVQNKVVCNVVEAEEDKENKKPKRTRSVEYESEEEESVYELSEIEPPSSMIVKHGKKKHQSQLITPPSTIAKASFTDDSNPFLQRMDSNMTSLERQIEEKVAAKLREISKGTILSPLLKSKTTDLDLEKLRKKLPKSKLSTTSNPQKPKSKRQLLDDMKAMDEMKGILNMFPTVEPDLLDVLNHGTEKQLRTLKELGQSRADLIVSFRQKNGPLQTISILHDHNIFPSRTLLKIVYANAMDAEGLASLAHQLIRKE